MWLHRGKRVGGLGRGEWARRWGGVGQGEWGGRRGDVHAGRAGLKGKGGQAAAGGARCRPLHLSRREHKSTGERVCCVCMLALRTPIKCVSLQRPMP
jgi:hypothetical protein